MNDRAWSTSPRPEEVRGSRDGALDLVRGVAIVLIVFLHADMAIGGAGVPAYEALNHLAGGVRMPVLMLIAGLLVARLVDAAKLGRRLAHFAWLFLLWTPFHSMAFSGRVPLAGDVLHQILVPDSTLWFIWSLAVLTASLPVVRRLPRGIVLGAAAALAMLIEAELLVLPGWALSKAASLGLFFYLGALGHDVVRRLTRPSASVAGAACLLVAFGWLVDLAAAATFGMPVLILLERAASCILALQIAGYTMTKLPALADVPRWLGRNTLPIFLAHDPLMQTALRVPGLAELAPSLLVPVLTLLGVLGALVVQRVLLLLRAPWFYALPAPPRTRGASLPASRSEPVA